MQQPQGPQQYGAHLARIGGGLQPLQCVAEVLQVLLGPLRAAGRSLGRGRGQHCAGSRGDPFHYCGSAMR